MAGPPTAPPAATPLQAAPAQHTAPAVAGPPANATVLHEDALQAEKHLEALATGLAHAGADPGVTKAVTSMADAMRRIVKAMGGASAQPPAQQPPKKHTMDSAATSLVNDVRAQRGA